MHQGRSGLRYMAVGLASMAAGGLLIVGALPGGAGAAVGRPSTHVVPTEVPGNATCPAGLTELKVGNGGAPVDGTFTDGTLEVTIDVRDTPEGQVFDWKSNIGVDVVIAKGGEGGSNVYTYDPEETEDTGLHAPVNPSGMFAGLSHISFCYDVEQATTTEVPTTEVPTTEVPTTEVPTTVGVSPTTAGVAPTTVPGALPRTGSTSGPMVGIGAALLAGGAGLVGFARRFRHS
jgi:LPXTG-motif cell wall-anchored protein